MLAAACLFVLAGVAVVVALRTDPASIGGRVDPENLPVLADSVPGPDRADGWIGSPPLTAAGLEGSVVVYDFWTYSCVNCVRTLPYVRAWHERYAADGLVVVGVHSPEFDFERDAGNVARAVDELAVTWPVALDPDHRVWDAFANRYWPAKYVVDRQGRLRYFHIGEGAYDETEDVLRELLGVDDASPRAGTEAAGGDGDDDDDVELTPETYLGYLRGTTASPEGLVDPDDDGAPGGEATFTVPDRVPGDAFALEGRWRIDREHAEARGAGAAIVLRYSGGEVNLVLSPGTVRVSIDGGEARQIVVTAPELVRLVEDGPSGEHVLRVEAVTRGVQAYAFTFGP